MVVVVEVVEAGAGAAMVGVEAMVAVMEEEVAMVVATVLAVAVVEAVTLGPTRGESCYSFLPRGGRERIGGDKFHKGRKF